MKGGKTGVKDVRDLRGVLDREQAAIGILISLQPPTGPMETEAASAGFYEEEDESVRNTPRLQLRTVKELMEGKGIERLSMSPPPTKPSRKRPNQKRSNTNKKRWSYEKSRTQGCIRGVPPHIISGAKNW